MLTTHDVFADRAAHFRSLADSCDIIADDWARRRDAERRGTPERRAAAALVKDYRTDATRYRRQAAHLDALTTI